MDHQWIELPGFSCIGLAKEGDIASCESWVPKLWGEFQRRSWEIAHFSCLGVWGLMSDPLIKGAPWGGSRGLYLAGWQVASGTVGFGDWQVWDVPARAWMSVPCRIDQIPEAVAYVQETLRRDPHWCWEGPIQEFYPPTFRNPQTDLLRLMASLAPR